MAEYENDREFDVDMSKFPDEMNDIELSLSGQVENALGIESPKSADISYESNAFKRFFKKIPKWVYITIACLLAVILTLIIGIRIKLRNTIVDFSDEIVEEQFEEDNNEVGYEEKEPESIVWNEVNYEVTKEKNIINILLVGEEAIDTDGARGRTDSILIATANFKTGELKLTSLMRDMYVPIPGFKDNKLNSAYTLGGIPLLKETIKKNFNIELDGAVLVDFSGFEAIVDSLGGVEISLTQAEADYMNTTNYVSVEYNRNLVAGKQVLNGNQALGFMRIRYVSAADNTSDDFGRTSRQRALLNAIFEKYKSKSSTELISIANNLLQYVQTDISVSEILTYVANIAASKPNKLQTLRIPADGLYDNLYIKKMAVLVPYLPENNELLHEFIFGLESEATSENGNKAVEGNP